MLRGRRSDTCSFTARMESVLGIDIQGVRRKYRRKAGIYDLLVRRPTARLRARAIARLALGPGARPIWPAA